MRGCFLAGAIASGALLLLACGKSATTPVVIGAGGGGSAGQAAAAGESAQVAGSADMTAGTGNAPIDERPARPAWMPPIPLGEPGWESSREPLCETHQGRTEVFDIWADENAVYAWFVTDCDALSDGQCLGTKGSALQRNRGTGWAPVLFSSSSVPRLSGLPGGPVVLTGGLDGRSGVFFVGDDGSVSLSRAISGREERAQFFGVDATFGYLADGRQLLSYADGAWSDIATLPQEPLAIWGDRKAFVAVGLDQTVVTVLAGTHEVVPLPDVPAGNYGAVWGAAQNDLWLGNSANQLVHYDGKTWTRIETGSQDTAGAGITHLWGAGKTVYFTTFSEFGRATVSAAELLLKPSAGPTAMRPMMTHALAGRSDKEVFLNLQDWAFDDYRCGSAMIVWFDGEEFHQF